MKKRYVIYWHDPYEPYIVDCESLEEVLKTLNTVLRLDDDLVRKIGSAKYGDEIYVGNADRIFVLRG